MSSVSDGDLCKLQITIVVRRRLIIYRTIVEYNNNIRVVYIHRVILLYVYN